MGLQFLFPWHGGSTEKLLLGPLRKYTRGIEANVLICRKGHCCDILIFSFYSFRMFPSGVATANHLPLCHPILCILSSCTNSLHILFHYFHKSPLRSSSKKAVISNRSILLLIYRLSPSYMPKPSQSGRSGLPVKVTF